MFLGKKVPLEMACPREAIGLAQVACCGAAGQHWCQSHKIRYLALTATNFIVFKLPHKPSDCVQRIGDLCPHYSLHMVGLKRCKKGIYQPIAAHDAVHHLPEAH
jgi:hypothetical protein